MYGIGSSRDGERGNGDSSSSEGADGANEQDSERARLDTLLAQKSLKTGEGIRETNCN